MSSPHTVLGDLFRAFAALAPGDKPTESAIAAMLHFAPLADVPASPGRDGYAVAMASERLTTTAHRDPPPRAPRIGAPAPVAEQSAEVSGTVYPVLTDSQRPTPPPAVRPDWLSDAEAFPPRAAGRTQPAPAPLFRTHQQRGILAAALATRSDDGPLDADAALRTLSERRPLERLPRLPVPTLRRGVQLLVDLSPAMDPYAADADHVTEAIRDVVGQPRVRVLTFRHTPREVFAADAAEPAPWHPPPAGTPVVVISELGIGGPLVNPDRSSPADWLELARRARAARCPLVALVPFAPDRWHPAVARAMTLVHWDRPTTAGAVRRAVGPGHSVG